MKSSSNKFTFILEKVKVIQRQRPMLRGHAAPQNGFGCGFGYVSASLRGSPYRSAGRARRAADFWVCLAGVTVLATQQRGDLCAAPRRGRPVVPGRGRGCGAEWGGRTRWWGDGDGCGGAGGMLGQGGTTPRGAVFVQWK